jgi:hypothetical protein
MTDLTEDEDDDQERLDRACGEAVAAMRAIVRRHYPEREAATLLLVGATIVAQAMRRWPDAEVAETVNFALEEYRAAWRLVAMT